MDTARPHENPDYLAKDYDSFRALMLDHLAKAAPDWSERDPADIVVALVEVLAYVGDYLSYTQDAVAAEAYIATARRRATVRRHARLVDYRLGEGVSARVLVQLAPAVSEVSVARGRALLAETPSLGVTVSDDDYDKYEGIVFETMHAVVLVREQTTMRLADGEAPRPGDVRTRLHGCLSRLERGDILLLHHVESGYRHPVRLIDAVADGADTTLEWHAGDAIPAGAPAAGPWIVLGNLVLADHGRTHEPKPVLLPVDDGGETILRCGQLSHVCPYDHTEALSMAIADVLRPDGGAAEAAMILEERAAYLPDDGSARARSARARLARATWTARRDMLYARSDERVFVAEPDGNGAVALSFGDGCHGRRPGPDWTYVARYRVGQGANGNISPNTLKHVVGLHGMISSVANPLGGTGGVDPENLAHARATAPLARPVPVDGADRVSRLFDDEPFVTPNDETSTASGRSFMAPAIEERAAGRHRLVVDGLSRGGRSQAAFLEQMRHLASREPPLDRLSTAAAGDITNALMSAWARVCDVLAFYQMRIAEEGFIGTAREPRSIRHLAHLLGVTFRPALGSRTHLAARLFEEGRPEGITVEPGALSVQDAPANGRQPIIFESSERATLRPSWNEIAPIAANRPHVPCIWKGCTSLRVVGTATGARPDRALLISAQGDSGIKSWLVTIATVLIDRKTETTLLTWEEGLPDANGVLWAAEIVEVILFRSSVGLFGRTAPSWSSLSEAKRLAVGMRAGGFLQMPLSDIETESGVWAPFPSDLAADAEVRALVSTPSGNLLAGTSKGVFRSTDGGRRWVRAPLAALVPNVFALHVTPDGVIYAGGAKGAMFTSTDDCRSWTQMSSAVVGDTGAPDSRRPPLGCTIRAIATVASGSIHLPMIGTDQGAYRWAYTAWVPCNDGFPGEDASGGLAAVSVWDLLVAGEGDLAATSAGLYMKASSRASIFPLRWPNSPFNPPKPSWHRTSLTRPTFALVSVADDAGLGAVVVGTDDGVFDVVKGEVNAPSGGRSLEKDLAGRRVFRLTRIGERLLATTDRGLFCSPREARAWRACDTQTLDLYFDADDACRQAFQKGRAPSVLLEFLAARGIALKQPVTVSRLQGTGSSRVWLLSEADGRAARVLELIDGDPLVVRRFLPLPGPAVVVAASGQLVAAVPFGPLLNRDWPGFHVARGCVFLDRAIEDLEPGQKLVLAPADGRTEIAPAVYVIRQATRVRRTAFGKTAAVTELTTDADPRQQVLDLRQTLAHVAPTSLAPYAPLVRSAAPIEGDTLAVAVAADGLHAGHPLLISGPRPGATIIRMGGIAAIDGPQRPPLLEQEAVLALAAAGGIVFAATASGLVVEWSEGALCRAANEGLPLGAVVHALAVHPNGSAIVAATAEHGVFCRRLNGGSGAAPPPCWFLLGQPSAPVAVLAVTPDGHVLAGTSDGVSTCASGRRRDEPPDWSEPAIGGRVHALAVGPDGRSFAGLDAGAVWSRSPDADWAPLPAIAPAARVTALAAGHGGKLIAGCDDGRVLLHADRIGWRQVCRMPHGAAIRTLLITDRRLWIGTRGAGAFERMPGGALRPAPARDSSDVLALVRTGSGAILAGRDAAVHLAGSTPRVLRRRRFADAGTDAAPALDRCLVPPSLAQIFANGGARLSSDVGVEVLAPGSRWLIRDGDQAWIAERLSRGLIAAGTPPLLRFYGTDLLDVAVAPPHGDGEWTVVHGDGVASFTAGRGQVLLQAARSDQPAVHEIVTLGRADPVPGGAQLALASALRRAYDRNGLRINGNVVPVTQGDTVPAEVLGSGTQAEPRQIFALRYAPLTYFRDTQGVASSLQIRVHGGRTHPARAGAARQPPQAAGQRWQETRSFLLHGPSDRVYVARHDEQGRTSIHFGDGVNGARLPSGSENVVASYRCGAGRAGNIAAGTLVALRRRPIGIRVVTNPLSATGGQDAQATEDLRIRARWQREPRQRIVSLADYATFAAGFPGVGMAQARLLGGERRTVCLWIGTEDGTSADDVPGLVESLAQAVAAARSDRLQLHVGGFAARTFRVSARILTRRLADPEVVTTRARSALLDAFSPSGHRSAGHASPALIRVVLEGVVGVASAQVTSAQVMSAQAVSPQPAGGPPGLAEWPTDDTARWDPAARRFVPPTLHLVDPGGIVLDVWPA